MTKEKIEDILKNIETLSKNWHKSQVMNQINKI